MGPRLHSVYIFFDVSVERISLMQCSSICWKDQVFGEIPIGTLVPKYLRWSHAGTSKMFKGL